MKSLPAVLALTVALGPSFARAETPSQSDSVEAVEPPSAEPSEADASVEGEATSVELDQAAADADEATEGEAVAEETPDGASDAPEDPAVEGEMKEVARELEELREAEDASVDQSGRRAAELLRALHRLGAGNPMRLRLEDALSSSLDMPIVPEQSQLDAEALAAIGGFDLERARKLYDIPIDLEPLVVEYIRFFQGRGRKHFVRWLGRSYRYIPMMRQALREEGLPEDTIYLAMIESGFSAMAYSPAKAAGIWQFIEPTGKRYGLQVDFWVDERRDPVKATRAAAKYLKRLYAEFGDWRLAWAGYNAGEGRIRRGRRELGTDDFWEIASGNFLARETRHYVPKLMAAALVAKNLSHFGFDESEISAAEPLAYDEVELEDATDLEVIARAAGVPLQSVKELNPELRRWCTPPPRRRGEKYVLKLPPGTRERFAENFAKIGPKERLTFRSHKVQRGDTLSHIALKFGTAAEAIMRMNNIRDSRRLRLGAELIIPVPRGDERAQTRLAAESRRRGYKPAPKEQEVPAGTPSGKVGLAGTVRLVPEGSRTKVVYVVAAGDSPWAIGQRFGVTVDEIRKWNKLKRRIVLRIGQELALYPKDLAEARRLAAARPATAAKKAVAATSEAAMQGRRRVVHVIAPGDTLWSIAQRYGVTVDELKRWNNIQKSRALQLGQPITLHLPGGSG